VIAYIFLNVYTAHTNMKFNFFVGWSWNLFCGWWRIS